MVDLIIGTPDSGKSKRAEDLALKLSGDTNTKQSQLCELDLHRKALRGKSLNSWCPLRRKNFILPCIL